MAPAIPAMLEFTGRKVLVTGGGKGIGAAIAARFVELRAIVTIADLDDQAASTAAEIGAEFVACDIADSSQLRAAIAAAAGEGHLDVMVNNAGIFPTTGPMTDADDDFVARMLDVNVRALFSATREAAARMTDGGSIVNLASIAGLGGGAGISAYAASKAGVVSLTKAHALELGPRGIRVNAIAPGVIETPGVADQMAPLKASGVDIDRIKAANALGVAGQPDHIARVAVFLASDLAAFVNGSVIVADGGGGR